MVSERPTGPASTADPLGSRARGQASGPIQFRPEGADGATIVRKAVMYAAGDVRVEDRGDPRIVEPTDAILRLSAGCVCGSDLWPYRGADPLNRRA